ncbi:MAG: hypothetical protein ACT4PV_07125 [Planctomycetaceae bacterium]
MRFESVPLSATRNDSAVVVAVFPDLWGGEQTVVARKGTEPWDKVLEAFRAAGCEARAKP